MATRRPPGLKKSGSALWRDITTGYALRPDELRLLEDVCRTADLIDLLQAAIDRDGVTTTTHTGAVVNHPAVVEIRQHRGILKQMVTRLNLPDADASDDGRGASASASASDAGRALVSARWGTKPRKSAAG